MEIVTGYRGEAHITADDQQALNAGITGDCVLAVGKEMSASGTANYVSDAVIVRKSPSIKPGGLYTILYEVRNNNSILSDVSGNNSYFYIVQENGKQFWGGGISEILEGTGTTSTFTLRTMAPDPDTVYHKRFTKFEDNGVHGADPGFLFRLNFRYGKKDYVDFELRISIYEGRYLGDYMPYVVSDVTDLEADIAAAQTTANGKNTVYYQASAPSGGTYKTNDIWFDTNDGNKMYMWKRIQEVRLRQELSRGML